MAQAKQRSSGSAERPSLDNFPTDLSGASKDDLLEVSHRFGVDFIRLQFTDIMGINKNVEVPRSQFAKALDGEIMFDGSSIEGFVRIEESDMLLKPDLGTFRILPYEDEGGRVARLLCDIYTPDEQPFAGCPRHDAQAPARAGQEARLRDDGGMRGGVLPVRAGARRLAHHDHPRLGVLLRSRARWTRARRSGGSSSSSWSRWASRWRRRTTRWRAGSTRSTSSTPTRWSRPTTSPPSSSSSGTSPTATATSPRSCPSRSRASTAAACTRTSRCSGARTTPSSTPRASTSSPRTALSYIEGLLQHARGFCAITNPLINSYKRLVPGYEAPSNVAWSTRNRSPLVRIPDRRGLGTRCELRMPDPVVQSVPRAHGAARGRARRRRAQARGARAGAPEHLHHELPRPAQVPDRRAAAGPARGAGACSRRTTW